MAEELQIPRTKSKAEKYEALLPQMESLVSGESDTIANLANISAAIKYTMEFLFVGFYIIKEGELVLGPFQGPIACTRIQKGNGVCGTCWEKEEPVIVDDVDEFPGHIACSDFSRSEIVLPVFDQEGTIRAVLDIDSIKLASFSEVDQQYLERICAIAGQSL